MTCANIVCPDGSIGSTRASTALGLAIYRFTCQVMTVPPGWFCALVLAISSAFDVEICRMVAISPLVKSRAPAFNSCGQMLTSSYLPGLSLVPLFPNFRQVIAQRLHADRWPRSAEVYPESLVPRQSREFRRSEEVDDDGLLLDDFTHS